MSSGRGDTGSGGSGGRAKFRAHDVFKCPELDVRTKKYLVRLANETANHLIRDTLEPNGDAARLGNDDDDDDDALERAVPDVGDDDDDSQVDARAAATNGLVWKKLSVVKGIQILRGHDVVLGADHAKDVAAACCLRGVTDVNASIEEFALLFKLDSHKQFADHGLLFNLDLVDMATLYALVQPSGSNPRRFVGVKWCRVQSPSKLFRDRDFCFLECQKEFRDKRGRRGWVRSLHSIRMPCCQSLEQSHGIVRASMYRCGLTAVESSRRRGVLRVTYTVELDLKGHFPELFQPSFIAARIATLASIDKFLQQQRLSSSPLLGDLDLPTASTRQTACHLCYRAFSALRARRVVCRKCGHSVCRSCSAVWHLDVPVIGKTKVRICTVCSADARYSHAVPHDLARACHGDGDRDGRRSDRADESPALFSPLAVKNNRVGGTAFESPKRREQRALSFSAPTEFHHLRDYYDEPDKLSANDTPSREPRGAGRDDRRHRYEVRGGHRQQRASSSSLSSAASYGDRRTYNRNRASDELKAYERMSRFDPVRATLEMCGPDSSYDPLADEFAALGIAAHARATTDLSALWTPSPLHVNDDNVDRAGRDVGIAAVPATRSDSPSSYFDVLLPQSFVASELSTLDPPHRPRLPQSEQLPTRNERVSHKVAPRRDNILFEQQQQQAPRDSYERRQSDFSWDPRQRDTTALRPSEPAPIAAPSPRPRSSKREHRPLVARFGYRDMQRERQHHHQQQQQQRRSRDQQASLLPQPRKRQQSYPLTDRSTQPSQSPATTRATAIYAQQRYRQQSDSDVHFPAAPGGRNFALEFFHEQYRNSNKPQPFAAAPKVLQPPPKVLQPPPTALPRRTQRPQSSPFDRSITPPLDVDALETRFSQPSYEFHRLDVALSPRQQSPPLQQSHPLQQSLGQTAGEVVEYVETPEGEWVEQRLTLEASRARNRHRIDVCTATTTAAMTTNNTVDNDNDDDVDEETLLHPGFCTHCGAKRVRHRFGAIEATCTCALGGQRPLEAASKNSNSATSEPSFESMLQGNKDRHFDSGDFPDVACEVRDERLVRPSHPATPFSAWSA